MSTDTITFNEILHAHKFTRHVQCPTQVDGHLLDVFLIRRRRRIRLEGGRAATWRAVGSLNDRWQCRPVEGQLRRHVRSVLAIVQLPTQHEPVGARSVAAPSDPDKLFTEYHRTLMSLLDQNAPVRRLRAP